MKIFYFVTVFIFGLAFGSFYNVCIYRIPVKKSLINPGSFCPKCKKKIMFYDNIPIVSYIILRGKCRYCQQKISITYPIIELLTGFTFLISFIYFGLTLKFFTVIFFLSILIIVSFIDLKHQVIPNKVILPAIIAIIGLTIILKPTEIIQSISGGLIGGFFILLLALLWPGGMGGGDIKLSAFIGFFIGFLIIEVLFLAFFIGALTGILMILTKKKSRKDLIPFGPFLSIAAFITLFWGQKIAQAYINLIS